MKFLYPEFLWALLILIVPIVIHLFNFKRYKTLYFSSISFIKTVDQTTRSTQKLKHLLVLATRLIAFTALIFAFAQPIFSDSKINTSNINTATAFYIDNSFSMETRSANGAILSDAKENAKAIINSSSFAAKYLIATNLKNSVEERLLSKSEALEKIDKIDFSGIQRNTVDIINWQNKTLQKLNINNARVFCFSDFQEINCSKTMKINTDYEFKPVLFEGLKSDNISIDSAWFSTPNRVKNKSNKLNVKLTNNSKKRIENCSVNFNLDSYQNSISASIDANDHTVVSVNFKDASDGLKSGRISVSDNNMTFDNSLFVSYDVKNELDILIINGKDFVPNISAVYSLDDFYKTKEVKSTSLTRNDLENKQLIVLNGLNSISTGTVSMLSDFYTDGGTLALFPGSEINEKEWNNLLSKIALPQIKSLSNKTTRINKFFTNDPFFEGVFRDNNEKTSIKGIKKHYSHTNDNKSNSLPLISLENGSSILEYNSLFGNAFMFYSSLKKEHSSILLNAIFPTVTLRISELSQRKKPLFLFIGSSSTYPIDQKAIENYPIHLKNNTTEFIPKTYEKNGIQYINLPNESKELKADNYQVVQKNLIDYLSLNYNRIESDLNYLKKDEIIKFYKNCGIENISFAAIDTNALGDGKNEQNSANYWRYFVIIAIIFFGLEMLIIRLIK